MSIRLTILSAALIGTTGLGDELLHRYEGDVHILDPSTDWISALPCDPPCAESVSNGSFRLLWSTPGGRAAYYLDFDQFIGLPNTLWVEWRFRSNHPFGGVFDSCDAGFTVSYKGISDPISMFGDAVLTHSGDDSIGGLTLEGFHTFRFESPDGTSYRSSVDGRILEDREETHVIVFSSIGFRGQGGCIDDKFPNKYNEWDYVRLGTIGTGEQIVSTKPDQGFCDPLTPPIEGSFAITFDQPNYVYVDDITVEVTGGDAPQALWTRRRDQDGPESLEIILDRPLPPNETTRFIISDGETTNIIRYTLQWADTNGDGAVDLRDAAALQKCFGANDLDGDCRAIDFDKDGVIDWLDAGTFFDSYMLGPE